MNTIEAIETRRSVKHYDPTHVMPEEDLAELIRLTKLAPSSFNMQNYRLLVVRDKELRQKIREAAWDQAHVTDASVLFIMCADLKAHVISFMIPVGKQSKPDWDRGPRLPDSKVVIHDRFPG